jgi:integrase/recombinase XerD
MSKLAEQFEAYLRAERGASENTVSNYLLDVRRFEDWLGGRPVEKVMQAHIQAYLRHLMEDGLSPRSTRRALATLRTLYAFLIDDEVITVNPARQVDAPKVPRALPKTLSEQDVSKMIRWAGSRKRKDPLALRDKAILITFYASGLRESELANLKLSDLDLESGFVKVWNGKGGKDGIAPLSPPAVETLKRYLSKLRPKLAKDSPHVFLGRWGESLTRQRIWQIVSAVAREAIGKHVSPHMLRHTVATALIKGGADLRDVQTILRHSDINTTQIYVHTDISYLRRFYETSHPRA